MLSFVQSWFSPGANPIGVDFGADCLRMAQVERIAEAGSGAEFRLVAAASAQAPIELRDDPARRWAFFADTAKNLWSRGNFRGRRAILALPAASMIIQHLRLPRMEESALKKALLWEARGKLPFDPSQAVLRHLVAGEVYQDQEPASEVILLAAARDAVNHYLAAAARARLDVVGMNIEPSALIDCFSHIYRRKADSDITNCFIDIGAVATRAIVARGGQILFARSIPIGGDSFSQAVADAMKISLDDARLTRIKTCREQPAADAPVGTPAPDTRHGEQIERACQEPLDRLIAELDLCRRYHEATFPEHPLQRLIFVGGEARQRMLCQQIAQRLNLSAQVGDPLVRLGRTTEVGVESGIDRREPQPGWAVALGLSMGAAVASAAVAVSA